LSRLNLFTVRNNVLLSVLNIIFELFLGGLFVGSFLDLRVG